MKLSIIAEARGKTEPRHFFHGVRDEKALRGILGDGVLPGQWDDGGIGVHPEARSFWTRSLGMALFYGHYVVEAIFNIRNNQIEPDEDNLGVYWAPASGADDQQWEEFFQRRLPGLPDNLRLELRRLRDTNDDDNSSRLRGWMRRNARAIDKAAPADQGFTKTRDRYRKTGSIVDSTVDDLSGTSADNMMYPAKIGFRGRNKIVGIYHFTETEEDIYGNELVCDRVIYNRGGTIAVGTMVQASSDWSE